jgi:hypothetical protein
LEIKMSNPRLDRERRDGRLQSDDHCWITENDASN